MNYLDSKLSWTMPIFKHLKQTTLKKQRLHYLWIYWKLGNTNKIFNKPNF